MTRGQLLKDVWRLNHEPGTNSVEVHVSRLRSKLASVGCDKLVETVPQGGYRLAGEHPFMFARQPAQADRLDRYLTNLAWTMRPSPTPQGDSYAPQEDDNLAQNRT